MLISLRQTQCVSKRHEGRLIMSDWLPIETAINWHTTDKSPFLVSNNPKARNALGQMSHVWLVRMIHRSETGEYFAFVGDSCWSKVRNLVLRKSIGRLP